MRPLTPIAVAASLVALAACSPKVDTRHHHAARPRRHEQWRAINKLACPAKQGELRRLSAAADGQSCVYEGAIAEVSLRLLALNGGGAEAALAPIGVDLKTLMPAMKAPAPPPPPDS